MSLSLYTWRARVAPAVIIAAPVLALAARAGVADSLQTAVGPTAVGGVVMILAAELVRSRGSRAQERTLKPAWDGFPTTKLLRHRQQQDVTRAGHRRARLAEVTEKALPTAAEEAVDPSIADLRYEDAVAVLRTLVRKREADYPLVSSENASYGFRRNLWALKRFAITLVVACLAIDVLTMYNESSIQAVAAPLMVHVVALLVWILFIRPDWVHEAARNYADQLMATLDDPKFAA